MTEHMKRNRGWGTQQAKTIAGNVSFGLILGGVLHGTIEGGPVFVSLALIAIGGIIGYITCKTGE